ncbi:PqqD family protein [Aquabacter sp. CN5-332]|uniref:PqqD family protein n=1 Tax=Aquabacter sp. CN5-332 TaxID=3156608 RepID=UPI0032B623D9
MGLGLDSHIVAAPDILSADVDGELVLMDAVSGKYFTFEGVGADIWRALGAPVSVGALCDRLVGEYDAPEERIRASTLRFLNDILERHLIKVV